MAQYTAQLMAYYQAQDEETEDQDIAEIQIKGSIKTDEVKATHIFI